MFLCETVANQLQQSKGYCGVSHVLRFVQRSKPRTEIRASDWLVTYLGAMQQKGWRSYIEEFRGSEAIEGFCCKFIYEDCRV